MISHLRSMLGRLQSLRQKITGHNPWVVFFGILFLASLVFLVLPAHAQQGTGGDVGDWMVRQVGKIMLVIANIAIGLSIFFLRFFIMIASYNNYIDVDVVQLGWIMVRDVANMFFVVALLVIAFGTILGLEEYEWKKNLVKLILAAILINFSNLICQLMIDVAHVFTITFLNAISATAGGNLITMFKLNEITSLAATQDPDGIDLMLLAAVIPAMLFAIMAACAIGSYVFVMAARVVALWALIILSPLAFILGVLPKTKSYAEKWWGEFTKYVIVAPVMVFFLWLSFATLGLGNIANQIQKDIPVGNQITNTTQDQYGVQTKLTLSLSKVTSWENMANFLIAFAFLMVGIKLTQETGTIGSGAVGGAVDFAKKVGTMATGYAAGRWLAGKTLEGSKWVGKEVGIGLAKRAGVHDIPKRVGNWWKSKGAAFDKYASEGPQYGYANKQTEVDGKKIDANYKLSDEQKAQGLELVKERNKDGTEQHFIAKKQFLLDKKGGLVYKSRYQKFLARQTEKSIASDKVLEKTENESKLNRELMDKRTEGLAKSTWGEEWGAKKRGFITKDYDRIKSGMLMAEEERSSAKTSEFKAVGKNGVLGSQRLKGEGGKAIKFQDGPTVAGQIAGHQERAAAHEERGKEILAKALTAFRGDKKNAGILEGKVKAQLEIKAQEAESHRLEEAAMTKVALADIAGTGKFNDAMDAYQRRLKAEKAFGGSAYDAEHEAVIQEMVSKGFIKSDEAAELRENAKLNQAIEASKANNPALTKEERVDQLVLDGHIEEKDKAKILKGMDKNQMLAEIPRENRQNVLARTIEAEKAGHLETTKLETAKKKEEEKFALGAHGQDELRQEVVLAEQTAASEAQIKREEAAAKAEISTGKPTEGKPLGAEAKERSAAFKLAQEQRIAAAKQAELRESRATGAEKAAELEYAIGDTGTIEGAKLEVSKEAIAATEAKIKLSDATVKAEVAAGDDGFKKQMAARIAAEKGAHLEEQKFATTEKEATEKFVVSKPGQDELAEEAALKARQAKSDAVVKEEENRADREYRDKFLQKYNPRLSAVQANLNSEHKNVRKRAEEQLAQIWDEIEADGNPVAQKIAAEKRSHTESTRTEQLEKVFEEMYAGSREGAHEMQLDAEVAARKALSEANVKRRESAAQKTFKVGSKGRGIASMTKGQELQTQSEEAQVKRIDAEAARHASDQLQAIFNRINISEQGTKAAEEFIKTLKSDKLKNTFKEAAEIMAKIMKDNAGDRTKMGKKLDIAAETNTFIAALKSSVKQKISDEEQKRQEVLASESAKAGFHEIPNFGKATPSTAIDSMVAQAGKDLKSMESQDGGALAARWVATILRQQKEKSRKGESISDHQRATLFAAISHITNEAWTDDTLAEISSLFSDLDNDKIDKDSDEGKDIQELKDVFIGQLGLMKKNDDGTYKSYSTPEGAAALQGLVVMGGNTKFVKAHNKISKVKDTLGSISESSIEEEVIKREEKKQSEEFIALRRNRSNRNKTDEELRQSTSTYVDALTRVNAKAASEGRALSADEQKVGVAEQLKKDVKENIKNELQAEIRKKLNDLNLGLDVDLLFTQKIDNESSYEDVAKVLADKKMLGVDSGVENFEQYEAELEKVQDIMQEASSVFKRGALNAGHIQNGAHQAYDARWGGQGKYRLMTPEEARAIMSAEGVKRSGLESSQYHSFGKVDNERSRLVEVDEKMFRVLTGQVVDANKIGAVKMRTLDQLMGYKAGAEPKKDDEGRFMMGGNFDDIKELMETKDDSQARTTFVRNLLMPMLRGNSQAFQLMLSKKGGVSNSIHANGGLVNATIDLGEGHQITGRTFSEFLTSLKNQAVILGINQLEVAQITKTIKAYQNKEASLPRKTSAAAAA